MLTRSSPRCAVAGRLRRGPLDGLEAQGSVQEERGHLRQGRAAHMRSARLAAPSRPSTENPHGQRGGSDLSSEDRAHAAGAPRRGHRGRLRVHRSQHREQRTRRWRHRTKRRRTEARRWRSTASRGRRSTILARRGGIDLATIGPRTTRRLSFLIPGLRFQWLANETRRHMAEELDFRDEHHDDGGARSRTWPRTLTTRPPRPRGRGRAPSGARCRRSARPTPWDSRRSAPSAPRPSTRRRPRSAASTAHGADGGGGGAEGDPHSSEELTALNGRAGQRRRVPVPGRPNQAHVSNEVRTLNDERRAPPRRRGRTSRRSSRSRCPSTRIADALVPGGGGGGGRAAPADRGANPGGGGGARSHGGERGRRRSDVQVSLSSRSRADPRRRRRVRRGADKLSSGARGG